MACDSGPFQGQMNLVAALMDGAPKIEYLRVYHNSGGYAGDCCREARGFRKVAGHGSI
jgi:hypothetical protein